MGAFKTAVAAVAAATLVASAAAAPTSVRTALKEDTKFVPCHYGFKEGYAYGYYDYNNNNNNNNNDNNNNNHNQQSVIIGGRK